jgi:hypothetical protein
LLEESFEYLIPWIGRCLLFAMRVTAEIGEIERPAPNHTEQLEWIAQNLGFLAQW